MPSFKARDGRTVAYRVVGDGPALVCHGGGPGFSSLYLGSDLAGLSHEYRLILLDPRGTGGSSRPEDARAYALDDYVDDLEELRAHLGEETVLLFGHSHGGVVAQLYAARYAKRIRAVVLASTLARFQEGQVSAMEQAMAARSHEPWHADAVAALEAEQAGAFATEAELLTLVLREMPFYFAAFGDAEREYVRSLSDDAINADTLRLFNTEVMATFDTRAELGAVTAPTLVIYGDQDFITGQACAEDIIAAIPRAERAVIEGAGHMVFVDAPAAFRNAVSAFLRNR